MIATTNRIQDIDPAVRRSGRFDSKIPIYPPSVEDRGSIFQHFVRQLKNFDTADAETALMQLAEATPLFAPADIKTVVDKTARRAVRRTTEGMPRLTQFALREAVQQHERSISVHSARAWITEARQELGRREQANLNRLEEDIERAAR